MREEGERQEQGEEKELPEGLPPLLALFFCFLYIYIYIIGHAAPPPQLAAGAARRGILFYIRHLVTYGLIISPSTRRAKFVLITGEGFHYPPPVHPLFLNVYGRDPMYVWFWCCCSSSSSS